jgi:hypothetical protein
MDTRRSLPRTQASRPSQGEHHRSICSACIRLSVLLVGCLRSRKLGNPAGYAIHLRSAGQVPSHWPDGSSGARALEATGRFPLSAPNRGTRLRGQIEPQPKQTQILIWPLTPLNLCPEEVGSNWTNVNFWNMRRGNHLFVGQVFAHQFRAL